MRVKTIRKDKGQIIFFPDSLRFFAVDNRTAEIIKKISQEIPYEALREKYEDISIDFYKQIIRYCNEKTESREVIPNGPGSVLSRLVINISNKCNMNCVYCYANGGTYHGQESIMSTERLKKILDLFFEQFDRIEFIQLFGGEPALNVKAIEYTCNYIRQNKKETAVTLVTNGTLLSEHLIEIIRDNNVYVTVSIDCRELHDELRPFRSGKGTYEIIKNNIIKLREYTGEPRQLEVTYTRLHDSSGISVHKLIEALKEDLGNDLSVHIAPVCTDNLQYALREPERFTESINDYFKYIDTDKKMHYSFVDRFLTVLKNKKISNTYCGGGTSTLAVSVTGDIYPCFYFVDNLRFLIGNVELDNRDSIMQGIMRVRKEYLNIRSGFKECEHCFANTVCFGCMGINYSMTGHEWEASQFHCEMVREGLEATLKNIVYRRERGTNG